jgi:hypothetical protein
MEILCPLVLFVAYEVMNTSAYIAHCMTCRKHWPLDASKEKQLYNPIMEMCKLHKHFGRRRQVKLTRLFVLQRITNPSHQHSYVSVSFLCNVVSPSCLTTDISDIMFSNIVGIDLSDIGLRAININTHISALTLQY